MPEIQRKDVDTKIPHLDVEKAWEKAKLLKEDLDNGEGWTARYHVQNEYSSWSKTFPNEEVPVKLLHRFENIPMSAEKLIEMMSPEKMGLRIKWDKTVALEILEPLPNGGCISRSVVNLSCPLSDRDYVVYKTPPYETNDWFGKKAFAIFFQNATHPSRPAGACGIVRGINGGNFTIAVQDVDEPGKCDMYMLTTNHYGGWISKSNEWLVGRKAPHVFYHLRQYIIDGYKEYFNN